MLGITLRGVSLSKCKDILLTQDGGAIVLGTQEIREEN